jgi:C-terminal processing protease CtpA/Prc
VKHHRLGTALALAALLSGCGGGGGSSPPPPPPPPTGGVPPAPPPAPPSSSAGCSLQERQIWAGNQLYEWYLFPETLPPNPAPVQNSVEGYIDALTATARAQGRDRYFTYLTSIAEENAFYNSGSSAGFGFRLSISSGRVFVAEAFEAAPALNAGIDRGTEILAIGTNAGNLVTVSSIIAAQGSGGVTAALGPSDVGVTRVLQVRDANGTRNVTISKADFELTPVSSRYGARIIQDGARRVGYVNLRTFISTADPALRQVFAQFRAEGITEIVVDLRYNGGGLVSIANLMGDLLGRNRSSSEVFSFTRFRPEKSQNDSTRYFQPQPQSVAATRLAFIGTGGTASASELVINSYVPYLGANLALVGTNTYGKPVGQIAIDRPQCDDRLRVVAFATLNAAGRGDYFTGLANTVGASCRATDDLTRQLGDPLEDSTRQALDFLAGRTCTPITGSAAAQQSIAPRRQELLSPDRPTTLQREVPGAF